MSRNNFYYDYDAVKRVPNKYHLTPFMIRNRLYWKDFDKAVKEKEIYLNTAFKDKHSEGRWQRAFGCQRNENAKFSDEDEAFFQYDRQKDKFYFDCYAMEGMCGYNFFNFYQKEEIENEYDMYLQVNIIRWFNHMIDEGMIGIKEGAKR